MLAIGALADIPSARGRRDGQFRAKFGLFFSGASLRAAPGLGGISFPAGARRIRRHRTTIRS